MQQHRAYFSGFSAKKRPYVQNRMATDLFFWVFSSSCTKVPEISLCRQERSAPTVVSCMEGKEIDCLTVVQSAAGSSGLMALRQGDPPDTIGASLHRSEEPHFSAFSSRAGASAVFRFLPSPLHPLRVNRWTIG